MDQTWIYCNEIPWASKAAFPRIRRPPAGSEMFCCPVPSAKHRCLKNERRRLCGHAGGDFIPCAALGKLRSCCFARRTCHLPKRVLMTGSDPTAAGSSEERTRGGRPLGRDP